MTINKDLYKLTSIDERGSRIGLIPAEVRGKFKIWRSRVHLFLLFIFLALPWIHIQNHQAVLLKIPDREFNFFGLLFRAHDAPLIFLVVAVFVMGLAFVTATWGRIWCGWACPQTVFIESVFRKIEFWVEGNYIERRKLSKEDWNLNKLSKFSLKWLLFTVVASLIAHSFIAYFSGSKELLQMMARPPSENWNYFFVVVSVTALILFDFAWFREQFCVIMCPYGRIQSVLLESNSLAVVYDSARGEPRRGLQTQNQKKGDCVSCNRCVEVCPTGIDIRNGLQMECISCTACIDACDEIMNKVKKPTGLISYKTLNGKPLRLLKAKTIFYGIAIFIFSLILVYALATREPLNIALLRATDAPYVLSRDENNQEVIRNHFRLHLTNQTDRTAQYRIELLTGTLEKGFLLTLAQNPITLSSKSSQTVHLFIHLPVQKLPSSGRLPLEIKLVHENGESFKRELTFIGPAK